jgi:predicted amidohydrolase YtcJ
VTARLLSNVRLAGTPLDDAPLEIFVRDGVIRHIGPAGSAGSTKQDLGTPEVVLDCEGRWAIPGLWDSHTHMNQWALARQRVDVSAAGSAHGLATGIATVAAERRSQPGGILIGYGFRDGLWPDSPSPELLDGVTGDLPTVMISGDLHSAWLNSAALDRFDNREHPTGVLREAELFTIMQGLSQLPDDDLDRAIDDAARAAAARGVVGIVDFEMPDSLLPWTRRIAGGTTSLRVVCSVWPEALERAIDRGLRTGEPVPGTHGLAVAGPLKVVTDGSLNTRTAYCDEPYPGEESGGHGILTVPYEQLVAGMGRAWSAGISSAIHAIGDHANRLAVDAFERVGCPGSIEHVQLIHGPDIVRMARLGIVASIQPEHAMDDRDVAEMHWAGRTPDAFAYRSMLDAGVRLALGSDAPVAPLDPWMAMSAAVFRSRDGREPWHPEQRIDLRNAMRSSTGTVTELRVGGPGDIVVVERDPFACDGDKLRTMPVFATFVAGRATFGPS